MADVITWETLRELAGFRASNGCAVSVYLGLDPTIAPTAGDVDTRVNGLLNEGEKREPERDEVTHAQREGLKSDFERIRSFFENEFSREGARGVAVFAAGADNYWRTLELADAVEDGIKVGRDFHLAPLVPLVGRSDGALVAFVGREQGRIFRLRAGALEEVVDRSEEQPGRHDQGGWSQARYQRHIEKLVHDHLQDVADAIDRQVRRVNSTKLVVIGAEETRAEFLATLSNETRELLAGEAVAEAHANAAELLEIVRPILEKSRAEDEAAALARWREEAGKNGRAASGWAETLEAASDGRVDLLLVQEGANRAAWQCPACGRGAVEGGSCPLDGNALEPRDEGLDVAVQRTLAHGGTIFAVRHHRDLDPVEGVGALLRY